eukprot:976066-Rhodomonas_salina.1
MKYSTGTQFVPHSFPVSNRIRGRESAVSSPRSCSHPPLLYRPLAQKISLEYWRCCRNSCSGSVDLPWFFPVLKTGFRSSAMRSCKFQLACSSLLCIAALGV